MSRPCDFRVLGPVRVLRGDEPLALGGIKRRSLLALLIAHRNRVVSVGSIAEALWEEEPPPSVASSIQVAVSALRSALAQSDAVAPRAAIETAPPGYRLVVHEMACDIGRFRLAQGQAKAAHAAGRLEEASSHYRQALSEWSGAAYEDLRDLRFACELAVALEEERLATIEAGIEVDLAAGKHRDVVGELAALTAQHPLRESLWTAYMTALFRCGRQADALAAFRTLRTTLMDELGLDPSASARTLESMIFAQDASLTWSPPASSERPGPSAGLTVREGVQSHPAQLCDSKGNCSAIDQSCLAIGRMSDNAVVLDDPKVSRYHATIVTSAMGYVLTDLHSTNGTRLNGVVIVRAESLADGDVIEIGSETFTFRALPLSP